MIIEVNDDDLAKALDRIARTADGELLYLYLQKILMELPLADDMPDGALRTHVGRRRFAGELMGRMAKGIDESGGRASSDGTTGGRQRPVVFVRREPVNIGRRESAREFIRRTTPDFPGPGDD